MPTWKIIVLDSDTEENLEVFVLSSDSEDSSKSQRTTQKGERMKQVLKPKKTADTMKTSKSGKATCDVKKEIPRFGPYGKDFCNLGIKVYIQSLQERKMNKKRKWTGNDEHWLMIHTCNLNKATIFL